MVDTVEASVPAVFAIDFVVEAAPDPSKCLMIFAPSSKSTFFIKVPRFAVLTLACSASAEAKPFADSLSAACLPAPFKSAGTASARTARTVPVSASHALPIFETLDEPSNVVNIDDASIFSSVKIIRFCPYTAMRVNTAPFQAMPDCTFSRKRVSAKIIPSRLSAVNERTHDRSPQSRMRKKFN